MYGGCPEFCGNSAFSLNSYTPPVQPKPFVPSIIPVVCDIQIKSHVFNIFHEIHHIIVCDKDLGSLLGSIDLITPLAKMGKFLYIDK